MGEDEDNSEGEFCEGEVRVRLKVIVRERAK